MQGKATIHIRPHGSYQHTLLHLFADGVLPEASHLHMLGQPTGGLCQPIPDDLSQAPANNLILNTHFALQRHPSANFAIRVADASTSNRQYTVAVTLLIADTQGSAPATLELPPRSGRHYTLP